MTAPARGAVLRLRPTVHASPVTDGLHVRGARTSFTVSGGPGLWHLWRALAAALTDGQPPERLRQLSGRPAVRDALDLLLAQLAEHDMLVEVPDGWGQDGSHGDPPDRTARWLEATAADPLSAWHALRDVTVTVRGNGRVAAAALRAVRAAGIRAVAEPLACAPDGIAGAGGRSVAADGRTADSDDGTAGGDEGIVQAGALAVGAMAGHDGAVVAPAGTPEAARANLAAIAGRAGLDAGGPAPHVLAALAGGAAAHRIICAAGGLPDPGTAASSLSPVPPAVPDGLPGVLVARLDPLRADYHPWFGGAQREDAAEPADLPAALAAAAALGDAELGVMPAAELADLPQLPAALARCRAAGPAGDLTWCETGLTSYGVGVSAETARLAAVTGWCAHVLAAALPGRPPVAVGANRAQAEGILLRRLADRLVLAAGLASSPEVSEAEWACSAQARLWWKAVTLRFAAPARMTVTRLDGGVFHAAVTAADRRLGWAVEATPWDAAAFAALTAAGALQRGQRPGQDTALLVAACGALPPAGPDGSAPDWEAGDWTWPAEVAAGDGDFRRALRLLPGLPATTVLEPAALCGQGVAGQRAAGRETAGQGAAGLLRALRAVGFAAVTVQGGTA